MKNLAPLALLLSCIVATSDAQNATAADPVVTHFREYRAALERNDFQAAEAAATAALQASEASQGRRTAVLALNLAIVRLGMSDPARALEPASRAYELATSTADSGVDPLHATLLLGRAQLAADDRSSAKRLREAIAATDAGGNPLAEAYDAAVALGEWALKAEELSMAQEAWAAAGRLVEHGSGDVNFSRGRARLLEGIAIFLGGVDRTYTQGGARVASREAHEALYAFGDALELFEPYAFPEPSSETLTVAQSAYAQTLAWRGALQAKLTSQGQTLQPPPERAGLLVDDLDPQFCRLRSIAEPMPNYPREVLTKGGVGAVVVHVGLDAEGNITKRQVAAVVPAGPLGNAVEAVFEQWRFERHPSSTPDCRLRSSTYTVMRFVLER